jgi:hypothetical protein
VHSQPSSIIQNRQEIFCVDVEVWSPCGHPEPAYRFVSHLEHFGQDLGLAVQLVCSAGPARRAIPHPPAPQNNRYGVKRLEMAACGRRQRRGGERFVYRPVYLSRCSFRQRSQRWAGAPRPGYAGGRGQVARLGPAAHAARENATFTTLVPINCLLLKYFCVIDSIESIKIRLLTVKSGQLYASNAFFLQSPVQSL